MSSLQTPAQRSGRTAGMSLVEMLVLIGIYTVLMLVITLSIQNLYQQNAFTIAQSREIDSARRGLDQWTRNAREMQYSDDGRFPVQIKEPHRFGFFSDIDSDPDVEYLEYELASTTLVRRVHEPVGTPASYDLANPDRTDTLSTFVQNRDQGTSTFRYFDSDLNSVGASGLFSDVRYIRAQFDINVDPLRSPGAYVLRSSVAPRNLKDNLNL